MVVVSTRPKIRIQKGTGRVPAPRARGRTALLMTFAVLDHRTDFLFDCFEQIFEVPASRRKTSSAPCVIGSAVVSLKAGREAVNSVSVTAMSNDTPKTKLEKLFLERDAKFDEIVSCSSRELYRV
jgi:hypothetical protein